MIKCVVFDVGGVLVKYKEESFSKYFARKAGIDVKLQKKVWYGNLPLLESGRISVKEFWNIYLGAIGKNISHKRLDNIFYSYLKPMRSGLRLARSLRKRYKTGLLSNWSSHFIRLDREYGITKEFDFTIVSFRTGYVKPQKEIYKLLIKKAGCKPGEIVYIDDYPRFVRPARELGIKGIVFKNMSQLKKELAGLGVLKQKTI